MVRAIGQIVLFIVLVVGAGAILRAIAMAAFPGLGSSSRPAKAGRGGKALRSPAPRAVGKRAWTEVKTKDWLEGRQHERANGAGGTVTYTTMPDRPTIRQRLRLVPFTPAAPASAGGNGQNGNPGGTSGTSQPSGTNGTQGPAPSPQAPPKPAQPASTNGGTVAAGTSTASAEKLIEGINEIHAHAASGGIHAKREALAAMHEAAVRFAAMGQMVARTMSEPGSNYGNEITEPIAKGAQQFQAGAITIGEAEANLTTLINMTVGDLATSARQAPHHRELSENGAH